MVYYRFGVDKRSNYCGTSWKLIETSANDIDLRFKQLSVGNNTVWAVTNNNEVYYRENITKSFPEGTSWLKVDSKLMYVTVNSKNEVYAVTSNEARSPNLVL